MWAQIVNTLIGLWIIIAPGILGYSTTAADNGHIIGPVTVAFSVISFWESTRGVRKWNYPLAAWFLLAPWVLGYSNNAAIISDMVSGALLIILTAVPWKIKGHFGGGWSSLWKNNPEHLVKTVKETD